MTPSGIEPRVLPACSAVRQQTAPPRAPRKVGVHIVNVNFTEDIYAWVLQVFPFSQNFPQKPCMNICSPSYVLHAPPVSFVSIFLIRIIFDDQYISLISSLCSILRSPVTSSRTYVGTYRNFSLSLRQIACAEPRTSGQLFRGILFTHVNGIRITLTCDVNSK